MGKVIKPDFIIVGAAKSGTTSIHNYLSQHPSVFMCTPKETNYFSLKDEKFKACLTNVQKSYCNTFVRKQAKYVECFKNSAANQIAGEVSPSYLYADKAPKFIKEALPNCKIIIILRHPVDRAFSNFKHHLRIRVETTSSFKKAILLEKTRIKQKWWWGFHYQKASFYYEQLKRYYDIFPASNILTLFFEDYIKDEQDGVNQILEFIGAEAKELKKKEVLNKSDLPHSYGLHQFINNEEIKKIIKTFIPISLGKKINNSLNVLNKSEKQLSSAFRESLTKQYSEDVKKLEDLIKKDCCIWGI